MKLSLAVLILVSVLPASIRDDFKKNDLRFLKITASPRSNALAGGGSAHNFDVQDLWSSANAVNTSSNSIHLNWRKLPDKTGANLWESTVSMNLLPIHTALGFQFIKYSDLEARDDQGNEVGRIPASHSTAQLVLGKTHSKYSWAISGKATSSIIDHYHQYAFMTDISFAAQPMKKVGMQSSVKNIGFGKNYLSDNLNTGIELNGGISYNTYSDSCLVTYVYTDWKKFAGDNHQFIISGEIIYLKHYSLRLGIPINSTTQASGGLGIKLGKLQINYGISLQKELGLNHFSGVSYFL